MLVDDDPLCNLLSRSMLRHVSHECDLVEFTQPGVALDYIKTTYEPTGYFQPTIIFLDINMPLISGWDFIQQFDAFEPHIKEQFTIHLLSSSLDSRDKEKAIASKYIHAFLLKPLRRHTAEDILSKFSIEYPQTYSAA